MKVPEFRRPNDRGIRSIWVWRGFFRARISAMLGTLQSFTRVCSGQRDNRAGFYLTSLPENFDKMRFSTILSTVALGLGAVVSAQRKCGSELSAEKIAAAEAHFSANKVEASALELEEAKTSGKKTVLKVYWHVISAGKSIKQGNVPDSQIKANIAQTNKDYSKTGISLKLVKITRTVNPLWFVNATAETPEQAAMKKALRKGGPADINVYTVGFEGGPTPDLLGYATFPKDYAGAPLDDGVVIKYSTLPGGSAVPYNQGKTFTHELGHWLG
ncbi:hypothetical protein FS749_013047, partial [Ceratobasidium sp. UAMH 11750]